MNLQENIQRIKQMMGLLTENEEIPSEFMSLKKISYKFNDSVLKLQEFLKSKKYYLGNFGPNKDGVDGKYGETTKQAHQAYLNGVSSEEFNEKNDVDDESNSGDIGDSSDVVIFMAGLESAMSKSGQSSILKKALGDKTVITHSYKDLGGLKESISKNPDSYVVLFSKACMHSSTVAGLVKNKSKLFIVEPYAKGGNSSVVDAVSSGVPSSNVIVAPNSSARGTGVVSGARVNNMGGHFDALTFVSKFIK